MSGGMEATAKLFVSRYKCPICAYECASIHPNPTCGVCFLDGIKTYMKEVKQDSVYNTRAYTYKCSCCDAVLHSDKEIKETNILCPECAKSKRPEAQMFMDRGEAEAIIKSHEARKADLVNHPPHYKSHPSSIECITIVRHMNFNLGNAIKYIWRADEKGNTILDLKKAIWYLNDEIARLEAQEKTPGEESK